MVRIIKEAEKSCIASNDCYLMSLQMTFADHLVFGCRKLRTHTKPNVKALDQDSYTGRTARHLAAFRGLCRFMPFATV